MSNFNLELANDVAAWLKDVKLQEGKAVHYCVLKAIKAHMYNPKPDMLAVRSVQGVYSLLKHNPSLLSGFAKFLPTSGGLAVDIFQQQPISLRTRGVKRAHAESMKDAMQKLEARKRRQQCCAGAVKRATSVCEAIRAVKRATSVCEAIKAFEWLDEAN